MAGRHRHLKRGTTTALSLTAVGTVLAAGVALGSYWGRTGVGAAARTGDAAAAVPSTSASWTPSRMAAATPAVAPKIGAESAVETAQPETQTSAGTSQAPETQSLATAGSAIRGALFPTGAATSPPIATPPPTSAAQPAPTTSAAVGSRSEPGTRQQTAKPFGGTPTAGILFFSDQGAADHFCTASVVDSPAGNLVITAGHCVYSAADGGYKTGIVFVPGYHDGQSPYGQWTPARTLVTPGWSGSADPAVDVGFLVMNKSSAGATIQSVTGADQIAFGGGFGQEVTVPAYPQGSGAPVTCRNPTSEFSSTQTEFDCGGYPDGTSGAPLLTDVNSSGEQGTVIGVIGGYEEGGSTPDVSYSSYFGSRVQSLYQQASAA